MLSLLSISAWSYDFSEADIYFANRDSSIEPINKAMSLYEQALINQVTKSEKIHAVERLAWLSYYKGDLLTEKQNKKAREAIFSRCLQYVNEISPESLGQEVPEYYIWKSACLSMWAHAVGSRAMGSLRELSQILSRGLKIGADYLDGNIYRIAAAVYSADRRLSFFGLYNLSYAMNLIEKSYEYTQEVYFAYSVQAHALKHLGRSLDAIRLLETKIELLRKTIQNNANVGQFAPENKLELNRMIQLLNDIRADNFDSDWEF